MKKILLIIFLVICFSGVASAEGAWVLWRHVDNNVNDQHGWELIKAFPEYKQCIQRQQQEFESDKNTFTSHSNPSRRFTLIRGADIDSYMFYRSSDGAQIIIKLMCLPDTIDPRK